MTSPRVVLSTRAKDDLRDIEAWIADHDGELRAAAVLERIWKTMHNIAFMPGMGRGRSYLEAGSRSFPVAPWTIVYETLPDGDGIFVDRVLHGRRDLPFLFQEPE